MRSSAKIRAAFTLVELVVVIMILGILAAIALPRVLGASQSATDNGVKQSLSVVRTAIDRYTAEQSGALPGADGLEITFLSDMADYLRGTEFPVCPVGAATNSAIRMMAGSEVPGVGGTVATHSWAYNYETGEFYVNSPDMSGDDVTTYDKFSTPHSAPPAACLL